MGLLNVLRRRSVDFKPPIVDVSCPILQHTGDGAFVGRCDHAVYGDIDGGRVCARHGVLADYPTGSDLDIDPQVRRFGTEQMHGYLRG